MANDPMLTGNTCQCAACSSYFKSDRAFQKHRTGSPDHRRCLTPEQMLAKGMGQDEKGRWVERAKVPLTRTRDALHAA